MAKGVGSKNKWEEYARRVDTGTSSKLATFEITSKKTLELLRNRRDGRLLDIGCGFGEIDVLLARETNFLITACDISDTCLKKTQGAIQKSRMNSRIKVEYGDVYNLSYPNDFFDIATSFGYASAATYKGAQNGIYRILKPNGLLICDFINALSTYKFFKVPRRWKDIKGESAKEYNFVTTRGIKEYFQRYNFEFLDQRFFNSYPPFNFLSKEQLLFFERTVGKFFNRFLGRVRLVCFRKIEK